MILNIVSRISGCLASLRLGPVSRAIIDVFRRCYNVDCSEASRDIGDYRSLAEFFTRDLRGGARELPADPSELFLSPVDGTLRAAGALQAGVIEQVKGKTYLVRELLQDQALAQKLENGFCFNLYLAPHDYHHVHFPLDCEVLAATHIPGNLWPVNNLSLRIVPRLFVRNERIVTICRTRLGLMALVMVGATNVGSMRVAYDSFITNRLIGRRIRTFDYAEPKAFKAGQKLGTFHLGSTVVALLERHPDLEGPAPRVVRVGEVLGRFARPT